VDSIDRIEGAIVNGSEGYFDEPGMREDLHVTIRIAKDFYDFLVKFGETPPADEIDYVMGTIRSGMDEFFLLAYSCRCINTENETWSFDRHVHWNFPELRETFIRRFQHLVESDDSAVDRLASLLLLAHLELVFLAQNFPPPFEYEKVDLETARKNLMDTLHKVVEQTRQRNIKIHQNRESIDTERFGSGCKSKEDR
jgi:hypothetical protein